MWKHSGIPVMKSTFSTWLTRSLAAIMGILTQRSSIGAMERRSALRYSIQRTMAWNNCSCPPLTVLAFALSKRTSRSEDSLRKPSKVMISEKLSLRNLSTLSSRSFSPCLIAISRKIKQFSSVMLLERLQRGPGQIQRSRSILMRGDVSQSQLKISKEF